MNDKPWQKAVATAGQHPIILAVVAFVLGAWLL